MGHLLRSVALVAALAVPPGLAAQPVQPGRFEVPGLDWPAKTAWRAQAELIRARRTLWLRDGNLRALNANQPFYTAVARASGGTATAAAVTGTYYVPAIAIAYADVPAPFPAEQYRDVLFSTAPHPLARPYSLKTYYEQLSRGRISMTGRVFDIVPVDSNATYYQQNCNGVNLPGKPTCPDNGRRFGLMLLAALDSISNRPGSDTVWSQFDNDGPDGVPNSGDDDGDVDFVTFLQPTRDGACGGPGIWAHRWVMSVWNGGSKYRTKTPRRNAAGQPIPGQFIRVDNYTIQSQVGGVDACSAPQPGQPADPSHLMSIGVVAHETGHAFGLPDLYDISGGSEGIGEWGIMGSGGYTKSYSPATYDAWSLHDLGWVTIDTLGPSRTVTTGPRQLSDTVFLARTGVPAEYLLVENRQAVNTDTAFFDPNLPTTSLSGGPCRSRCRKLPGLLIWHIDESRIAQGRFGNTVNTGQRQGVALIQADGSNDLRRSGGNRGDRGDSYPGLANKTVYNLLTNPGALTNQGSYTGFVIDQVAQLAGGAMRFRFLRRQPSVVEPSFPPINLVVNGDRLGRFDNVVPPGDPLSIAADEVQEVFAGKSRGRFSSWSNGGTRVQTITSGATKPDTLIANYLVDHRARTTITGTGGGSVQANVAGNPAEGIYLVAGTPITLTATPAAGSIFGGWIGDTATANPSVTLPMSRGYDLEANFLAEVVAVPVADATSEILGTARLTDQQRIFLDLLGNRNSVYDVGDYLALLRRSGQAPSAAILRAIAGARSDQNRSPQ
ncbi:MAG: M6 family metalloprotease domain-containing protein [Gemmatimonadetes bacterium]|nr:M6 family metalloprotease domain-containing protein [Gemmatimonadota bacterium]